MSKPKVVDIKRPPATKKPKVIGQKDRDDDYSLLLQTDEPSQELREEQLRDLRPAQPNPSDKIEALTEEELRRRIEDDRKKRKGSLLGRLFG